MHPPTLVPFLLPLVLSSAAATAQSTTPADLEIVNNPSSGWVYHGCYNETTDLPDTTGVRALANGANRVSPGEMTVQMCWDFCSTGAGDSKGGTSARFKFAGLEYARYVS